MVRSQHFFDFHSSYRPNSHKHGPQHHQDYDYLQSRPPRCHAATAQLPRHSDRDRTWNIHPALHYRDHTTLRKLARPSNPYRMRKYHPRRVYSSLPHSLHLLVPIILHLLWHLPNHHNPHPQHNLNLLPHRHNTYHHPFYHPRPGHTSTRGIPPWDANRRPPRISIQARARQNRRPTAYTKVGRLGGCFGLV